MIVYCTYEKKNINIEKCCSCDNLYDCDNNWCDNHCECKGCE